MTVVRTCARHSLGPCAEALEAHDVTAVRDLDGVKLLAYGSRQKRHIPSGPRVSMRCGRGREGRGTGRGMWVA